MVVTLREVWWQLSSCDGNYMGVMGRVSGNQFETVVKMVLAVDGNGEMCGDIGYI